MCYMILCSFSGLCRSTTSRTTSGRWGWKLHDVARLSYGCRKRVSTSDAFCGDVNTDEVIPTSTSRDVERWASVFNSPVQCKVVLCWKRVFGSVFLTGLGNYILEEKRAWEGGSFTRRQTECMAKCNFLWWGCVECGPDQMWSYWTGWHVYIVLLFYYKKGHCWWLSSAS